VQGFGTWTRAEAERLGLPLINLTHILLARDFLDGLHANARGNRKTAGALSAQLVPVLRARIAEVLPPH
jgi:lysophospholipase L1-like esterase